MQRSAEVGLVHLGMNQTHVKTYMALGYRGGNHQLNPAIYASKCLMYCLSVTGIHGAGNSGAGHRPVFRDIEIDFNLDL